MSIFKGKKEKGPPDIGKETEIEFDGDGMADSLGDFDGGSSETRGNRRREEFPERAIMRGREAKTNRLPELIPYQQAPASSAASASSNVNNFELEKMNARMEMLNSLITGFNERFSGINQQIGEIRAMAIANEKNLSISNLEAKKVVDIVKEVDPEKLRLDYQRINFKITTFMSKLESYKQYMDSIMEELKELKRRANLFEGTDALLKLNEDVKKDLIQIQKVNAKVRLNADKSEQIFIELSKGFQETQKINEMIANLDESYSGLKKDIEKLTLDYSKILDIEDFSNFKTEMGRKLINLNNSLLEVEKIKGENENLSKMIGKIILMEKRNEEDIGNVKLNKGGEEVKKISDYEAKLFSLLELTEKIASEINRIKERVGLKTTSPSAASTANESPETVPEKSMRSEAQRVIPEKERKINSLLARGKELMTNGDLTGAWDIYKQIFELYKPEEDSNKEIYHRIIRFYDTLSGLMKRPFVTPKEESAEKNAEAENPEEKKSTEFPQLGGRRYKQLADY